MGISERTYYRWMAAGRQTLAKKRLTAAEQLSHDFYREIRAAQAAGVMRVAATHLRVALGGAIRREVKRVVINEDGAHEEIIERDYYPPHPGAMQWWLERRARADYGPVAPRDPDGADQDEEVLRPDGADVDPTTARAELDRILDRLAAAPAAPAGPSPDNGGAGV